MHVDFHKIFGARNHFLRRTERLNGLNCDLDDELAFDPRITYVFLLSIESKIKTTINELISFKHETFIAQVFNNTLKYKSMIYH